MNSTSFKLHQLVFALDRSADRLLREKFGISHKRGLFLVVLQGGRMTQHELATALGYTDPAVSAMLVPLAKDGYVVVEVSPDHKRKRLVSVTARGRRLAIRARAFMDETFEDLLKRAGVESRLYGELTERIFHQLAGNRRPKHV
jgi:DNA-binding MarR family transcriptional regulator